MATLLFRLGRFAATRIKTVIAFWFALLLASIGAFALFSEELSTDITLPDMETLQVQDRIEEEIPDASEGSGDGGQALLQTEDGESFTTEQRDAVGDLVEDMEEHPQIAAAHNPFTTRDDLLDGEEELAQARDELNSAEEEVHQNRADLSEAREELDAGQEELDAATEEAEAQGVYELAAEEFEAQQAELDAAYSELAAAEDELDEAEEEISEGFEELERSEQLFELTTGAVPVSEDGSAAILMADFEDEITTISPEDFAEINQILAEADIEGVEVLPGSGFEF
ncbi:hypothetical protein [Nesterenkonia alba]|uniref:hypothetical protein n=1 Tax=Nesterenkonia alba TaxID=515814 RepID=UPI000A054F7E|nr:hypothetical protein [Nesterenkonia alba]